MKPGAMEERRANDKRGVSGATQNWESEIVASISILNFITIAAKQDPQICDYIIESTHIADFCAQWIDSLNANWNNAFQAQTNAAYVAVMQCLHTLLYISREKAARGMGETFNYYLINEALDLTSSL
jgi:hypothetical protein